MENGQQSFMHARILKNHAITPVGIRGRLDILPIKGYKIAFLAYSCIEDTIVNGCYNKIQSAETILEEIQKATTMNRLILSVLKRFDVITVTGTYTRNFLVSRGIDEHKIFILPHVVDERFRPLVYQKRL